MEKWFSCLKKTGLTKYRSDQIKNSSLGDFFVQGKGENVIDRSPESQWIISAGREKGRGIGCQNNGCVAGTENDQMREVALKQIQALALLG